ncbi:hypothetical protein [Halobacillus halophilus]|uniref:hypothetical protein n=1 Tax=Halobacillus halophilus TaxID=1570 RepID=UPI001CD2F8D0|nr:hypothetical protein [Halobacillus halophilus]MCA1010374.1 hypothetical protein [Halobacillus halophilus]
MSMKKICFATSDWPTPTLDPVAEKIADLLYSSSFLVEKFADLMRISEPRNLQNYKPVLKMWSDKMVGRRKKAAADVKKLAALAEDFFSVCSTDDELLKMRGLVPEKLFEKIFEERHKDKICKTGYGVKVVLDGKEIKYRPASVMIDKENNDEDKPKQSVDAGFWDGANGEFVEIKLSPRSYQTKDVKYLKLLAAELTTGKVPFVIFLVTLDNKDLTEYRLKELSLDLKTSEYLLVGRDELFELKKTG